MTTYPLWMQSDIIAMYGSDAWKVRREKTFAALKKIKDEGRADPLAEFAYSLGVRLVLMEDEAVETQQKVRALDDQLFFMKARMDGLWETLEEMRNRKPDDEGGDDDLLERLASQEHEQWAHWTAYFLANLAPENVERWKRQIETPYAELSEKEKESDREWARRALEIISERVTGKIPEGFASLWEEYALRDPANLSTGERALRIRLLDVVQECARTVQEMNITDPITGARYPVAYLPTQRHRDGGEQTADTSNNAKTITNPVTGTTYPVADHSGKRSGKKNEGLWKKKGESCDKN